MSTLKKSFVALFIAILVLLAFAAPAIANVEKLFDLSQYTTEELIALYQAVRTELFNRSGDKEPVSVVSCSLSKTSTSYYTVDFKIKNNIEVPINTITLTVVFVDKDGNTVNATYPQEPQRLRPGKTQIIDALCKIDLAPKSVYIDKISYYDDESVFHTFYLNNPEEFFVFK